MTVDDVWHRHRQWVVVGANLAARVTRGRLAVLILLVLAAVLGAASTSAGIGAPIGAALVLAAGISLAGTAMIQVSMLSPQRVTQRDIARAAAAVLRSAVFVHRSGVEPSDGDTRETVLEVAWVQVEAATADLEHVALGSRAADDLLPDEGFAAYVERRVRKEYVVHLQRASDHQRRARYWWLAEIVTLAIAALLALASYVTTVDVAVWVGVSTTVAAAVNAHVASGRNAARALTHSVTAHDLQALRADVETSILDGAAMGAFVAAVEDVLAVHFSAVAPVGVLAT